MADRMLQIERVQISDEGVYVCRVENSVGWREAEAKLVVHCTSNRSFIYIQGGAKTGPASHCKYSYCRLFTLYK